jgi:hypothetical protein
MRVPSAAGMTLFLSCSMIEVIGGFSLFIHTVGDNGAARGRARPTIFQAAVGGNKTRITYILERLCLTD